MRKALFLSIGLALSQNAIADDERCVVSFSSAQLNVCNTKVTRINSHLDVLADIDAAKASTLRLIKFDGPIDAVRRSAVESLGAQIVGYAPFHAYIVRMAPDLDTRARAIPGVIWSGAFLPAFKIDPNIANELQHGNLAQALGSDELEISLVDTAKRLELQSTVQAIAGLTDVRHVESGGESRFIARFDSTQLSTSIKQLALNDEVIAVGLRLPARLENSQAGWLHQSNIVTPRPLRSVFDHGLFGCGQVIGALDTGLHFLHCSFNDTAQPPPLSACTTGSSCPTIAEPNQAARKVIAYYKWSNRQGSLPGDDGGHGTHVAGSILGQNPAAPVDCSNFTTPGGNTDLDGTAPGAKLVMQEMGNSLFYLNSQNGNPYHAAKAAYDNGARLHSNSWGAGCTVLGACIPNCRVTYGAYTRDADRIMREAPDLLVLFAAGNDGTRCPAGNNMGAAGNAKNVLTVGATGRGSDANAMADFSSRGPTIDGRTKPDITAQGVGIVSAQRDACGTLSMSGTSMATPTAAGLAALVREYLQRGFYPTGKKVAANAIPNPSGALIKAILISGAATMSGAGAGASPGQSQGFGRILLDDSLHFEGDASRLYIHDSPRGLITGDRDYHTLVVSEGTPFDVTLTWTDEAAAVNADPALVNSLRLEVVAPNGEVWSQKLPPDFSVRNANPSADTTTTNYDNRNTVQRVRFSAPAAGAYQIRVNGISIPLGEQKYALAATGNFRVGLNYSDFELRATPTARDICAGQPADFTIGAQGFSGFSSPVALSVAGLPENSSATFTPASVVPANPAVNSTLKIDNTSGVAGGSYRLLIQGSSTSPALDRSVSATLNISPAIPPATQLTAPANYASGITFIPTFSWDAAAAALSYRFQLSTSSAFANLVENQTVTTTTFTPTTVLSPNTTYYWRVVAINTCGEAPSSPVFSFTTETAICRSPGLNIRDNDASGISDSLRVGTTGTLPRLRLWLNLTHTYVGDLTVSLSKGDTTVTLLQRPGNTPNTGDSGCSGDNLLLIADDDAGNMLETHCAADPAPAYTVGAAYKPDTPLSAFTGAELSGQWTLKVVDSANGNVGTIHRWCLLPAAPAGAIDVIFRSRFQ
ncbi:MAG: S8 family serine peptidase [Rhodanobacteraceae bacterium]|nr:S8 family serine peptidase [Rhodanobacteraceae bacterium]